MRVIGMDVRRWFAQAAIPKNGRVVAELRVDLVHDRVVAFGRTPRRDDEVVIEGEAGERGVRWTARPPNGNTVAVERPPRPFVGRVVIASPRMVRAIAHARVETDTIGAIILARLQTSKFLSWVGRRTTTPSAGAVRRAGAWACWTRPCARRHVSMRT